MGRHGRQLQLPAQLLHRRSGGRGQRHLPQDRVPRAPRPLRSVLGQHPGHQLRHRPRRLLRRIRRPRRAGSRQGGPLLQQHRPRLGPGRRPPLPPDSGSRGDPDHPLRSGLHREPRGRKVHRPRRHQQDPRRGHDGPLRHRRSGGRGPQGAG